MDRASVQVGDTTEQIGERTKHVEEGTALTSVSNRKRKRMVPCFGDRTAHEQHQRYHRARNSHAGAGARC